MAESLKVKRQVVVKTIVTDDFKQKAQNELTDEIKLIDEQINHLQLQLNQVIQQFQQSPGRSLSANPQEAEQIINELNIRLQQLMAVKQNLQLQINNVVHAHNGEEIITGSLENYVELKPGDNIYEKMLNKEITIEDGIVKEIKI